MRIAYISYEHPCGITGGGIGTYVSQVAKLMAQNGHEVEVFIAHHEESESLSYDGYSLHKVLSKTPLDFRLGVVSKFLEQHSIKPFDIVESAEYRADALYLKDKLPDLPLVVKLHTPTYLTQELNNYRNSPIHKLRFIVGGLLRGKISKPYWSYRKENDPEYLLTTLATSICSPSRSLALKVKKKWSIQKNISIIPNPFIPHSSFLTMPPANYSNGEVVVSFLGRLEKRKGVLELAKAIPTLLKKHENLVFHFIGKPLPSPLNGLSIEGYIKKELGPLCKRIRFFGQQPYSSLPILLQQSHICIFPSLWENFPNVCLEAMSAGRAVIASNNGGMAEMIESGRHGILIPPNDYKSIISAIDQLLLNKSQIKQFGGAARERVLEAYNAKKTGFQIIELYKNTIKKTEEELAPILS